MKKPHNQPSPNQALPKAGKNDDKLRKRAAFATLAVEEFSRGQGGHDVPKSSDSAVEEAREWVAYDEL